MSKKRLNVGEITNELRGASAFFANPPASPVQQPVSQSLTGETGEDKPVQKENRSIVQPNEGSIVQSFNRSDVQLNERSNVQAAREIARKSYDVYLDQDFAIDALATQWGKGQKRHVTKGEVIRKLLDEVLATKK